MFTIKRKLIALMAAVLAGALGSALAVFVFSVRAEVTSQITTSVVDFAGLSSERIAELYDLYYRSEADALFQSELTTLLAKAPAVSRVELATAEGELLFSTAVKRGEALPVLLDRQLLQRLRVGKPSLATPERVVYLAPAASSDGLHAAAYSFADAEGAPAPRLAKTDQAETVVHPLADAHRRLIFHVDYSAVSERVRAEALYVLGLLAIGFLGSFLIATRFASSLTSPLAALRAGAQRIAQGDLGTQIEVTTRDETRLLADTFNQMATDLSAALEKKVAYERTARELELAAEIQSSSLPSTVTANGIDLSVYFSPAAEVGGDIYDVITRSEYRTLFYLADATGHGVPAGLVASLTSAVMATAAEGSAELPSIITAANRILHAKTKPNMFATLIACEADAETGELQYINAGHEPALIYRAATGQIESAPSGTLGLGMLPRLTPEPTAHTLKLAAGDALLIFTDGITEAANAEGELLGSDRLREYFCAALQQTESATAARTELVETISRYTGSTPQADDITFFLVRQ
jgi:serine phosphatase RsbU (regulator of sigma subunit)